MGKRGRPSEQLKRETAEGLVWSIVRKLRENGDLGKTIRDIARLSRCSVGAVSKTLAWKGYRQEKTAERPIGTVEPPAGIRRRRAKDSVEGRVIQIAKEASDRNDFSLTVSRIASMIGCSTAAVGKTEAWRGYVRAREEEKEIGKGRRKGLRIK